MAGAAGPCAELVAGIAQRYEHGGPSVTPAEESAIVAQLTACRDQDQITLQQYDRALRELQELNLKGQPHASAESSTRPRRSLR